MSFGLGYGVALIGVYVMAEPQAILKFHWASKWYDEIRLNSSNYSKWLFCAISQIAKVVMMARRFSYLPSSPLGHSVSIQEMLLTRLIPHV
jgi:hypothetical protein